MITHQMRLTTMLYIETLRRIASAAEARAVLEIGVGPDAVSAGVFMSLMGEGGHLVSIEIDEARPTVLQHDLLEHRSARWTVIHGDSLTVEIPTDRYDLLYIDGDHAGEYPLREFERFEPYVRRGGYIILDDFPRFQGVYQAVMALERRGWTGLFLPYDPDNENGHMVYRKPGRIPMPTIEGST